MLKRSKDPPLNLDPNQLIDHEQFLHRIRKTLYYGPTSVKCQKISRPLADCAADLFSETHRGHSLNRLNFIQVGNLNVTPCSLIISMIYLDRLNDIDPAYAKRITPSELFLVSMMVSTKFYCGYDEEIYISVWAEYGKMSVDRMKALELEFLDAMNWNMYVSNTEFFDKLKTVERLLAKRQGLQRGWMTYTELMNLLPTLSLVRQIINYSTVLAMSYAAGVMTIAGAFFLASHLNVPGNVLYRSRATATTSVGTQTAADIRPCEPVHTDSPLTENATSDYLNNIECALPNEAEFKFYCMKNETKERKNEEIPYFPNVKFMFTGNFNYNLISRIDIGTRAIGTNLKNYLFNAREDETDSSEDTNHNCSWAHGLLNDRIILDATKSKEKFELSELFIFKFV